ncbi:MAG: hypothetical protein D6785_01645, partial [Planctomycetota bacterium]
MDMEIGNLLESFEIGLAQQIKAWSQKSSTGLTRISHHLCLAPKANRVRPFLIYQFGKLLKVDPFSIFYIALAAELTHTASLMHDDVLDMAYLRRGRKTVNAKWGNEKAVLGGDFLFVQALKEVQLHSPHNLESLLKTITEMVDGVYQELEWRKNLDISVSQWREMALKKTGALFQWCGEAVERQSMVEKSSFLLPETYNAFGKAALHFGLAFQMADDLKDFLDSKSGKKKYQDLQNGNPNLCILLGIQKEPTLKKEIPSLWLIKSSQEKCEYIHNRLHSLQVF